MQHLIRALPFQSEKFKGFSRLTPDDMPRCEVCEFTKSYKNPTKGNKIRTNTETDGSLKINNLRTESSVFIDHF